MAIQRWKLEIRHDEASMEHSNHGGWIEHIDHLSDKTDALARQREGIAESIEEMAKGLANGAPISSALLKDTAKFIRAFGQGVKPTWTCPRCDTAHPNETERCPCVCEDRSETYGDGETNV